jgi:hypothetical protein
MKKNYVVLVLLGLFMFASVGCGDGGVDQSDAKMEGPPPASLSKKPGMNGAGAPDAE